MQKEHKRCLRRIIAAALVMLMVSGTVPVQPIAEVFDTAITASAYSSIFAEDFLTDEVNTLNSGDQIYGTKNINGDSIKANYVTVKTSTGKILADKLLSLTADKDYNVVGWDRNYLGADSEYADYSMADVMEYVFTVEEASSEPESAETQYYTVAAPSSYNDEDEDANTVTTKYGVVTLGIELIDSDIKYVYTAEACPGYKFHSFKIEGTDSYAPQNYVIYDAPQNNLVARFVAKTAPTADNFTFTAPSELAYNGTAKAATVESNDSGIIASDFAVKYYSDAERKTEVSAADVKNAGTYYVAVDVQDTDDFVAATKVYGDDWNFTISKAAAPTLNAATGLTYNGSAQELVNAADVPEGTLFGNEPEIVTDDNGLYLNSVKKGTVYSPATNVGIYFPDGYKMILNGTEYITQSKYDGINLYYSGNCIIMSYDADMGFNKLTDLDSRYNGILVTDVNTASKTFTVVPVNTNDLSSLDNSLLNWTTDIPKGTNAGTYTVYYKGDGVNYDDTVKSVSVSIEKADPTVTAPTGGTVYYAGSAVDLVTPGTADGGTMKYGTLSYEPFNVYNEGKIFETAADLPVGYCITTEDDQGFYLPAGFSLKIDGTEYASDPDVKIHFYRSASGYCFTYGNGSSTKYLSTGMDALFLTGQSEGIITAKENSTADRINNAIGNGWSETVPTANAVGNYTVYYKVEGDANHNDSTVGSVDVEVKQSTATVKIELVEGEFAVDYIDDVTKNSDGTYTVNAGASFVIYSNTYITENSIKAFVGDEIQDYIDYNYKRNGEVFDSVKYRYIYTVYIPADIANGTEVSIKHIHKYGTPYNGENDSASLYTVCETDTGAEAITIAKLKASGEYYYGDTPSYDNDVELYTSEDEDLVIQKGILRFRHKGSNENLTAFEEPGEYVVEATVKVNGTTYSISKEVTYSARPLTDASVKFYLGDEELTVTDGLITLPAAYTYNGGEQTPAITVKNTIDGTTTQLTAGTDYTVAGASAAKNAGDYTFTITGKGSFKGTVTVNWSIAKADADITFAAKDNIVYDGKKLDLEDFDVTGANAELATETNTTIQNGEYCQTKTIPGMGSEIRRYATLTNGNLKFYGYMWNNNNGFDISTGDSEGEHTLTVSTIDGRAIDTIVLSVPDYLNNEIENLHGVYASLVDGSEVRGEVSGNKLTISGINSNTFTLKSTKSYWCEIQNVVVSYTDSTAYAGTYYTTITIADPDGNGNYKPFSQSSIVTINKKPIDCTLTEESYTYGDVNQNSFVSATATADNGVIAGDTVNVILEQPTEAAKYTSGFLNAGTYTLKAQSDNSNYTINDVQLTVGKKTLMPHMINDPAPLTYNGKEQTVTFTATDAPEGTSLVIEGNEINLIKDTDFIVSGNKKTNVGDYTATITAAANGNYQLEGSITKTWSITAADLHSVEFVIDPDEIAQYAEFAYSGSNDPQSDFIKVFGVQIAEDNPDTGDEDESAYAMLTKDSDYTLKYFVVENQTPRTVTEEEFIAAVADEYQHAKAPNTYIVVAQGKGNYKGVKQAQFTITAKAVEDTSMFSVTFNGGENRVYDGTAIQQNETKKDFAVTTNAAEGTPESENPTITGVEYYKVSADTAITDETNLKTLVEGDGSATNTGVTAMTVAGLASGSMLYSGSVGQYLEDNGSYEHYDYDYIVINNEAKIRKPSSISVVNGTLKVGNSYFSKANNQRWKVERTETDWDTEKELLYITSVDVENPTPKDAGTYIAKLTVKCDNTEPFALYKAFEIEKKDVNVTLGHDDITWGELVNYADIFTATGLLANDTTVPDFKDWFTVKKDETAYDFADGSKNAAGEYTLAAAAKTVEDYNAGANNYTVTIEPGTMTVKPYTLKTADVSITGDSPVYDGEVKFPALTVTAPYTKAGEAENQRFALDVNGTKKRPARDGYTSGARAMTDAGTYTISVNDSGNFDGKVSTSWTIAPAAITVTIDDIAARTYDGTATANVAAKVLNGDTEITNLEEANITVTYTYEKKTGEDTWEEVTEAKDAGTYRVTVAAASDNYAGAPAVKEFTINKATVTAALNAEDLEKPSGYTDGTVGVTFTGLVESDNITLPETINIGIGVANGTEITADNTAFADVKTALGNNYELELAGTPTVTIRAAKLVRVEAETSYIAVDGGKFFVEPKLTGYDENGNVVDSDNLEVVSGYTETNKAGTYKLTVTDGETNIKNVVWNVELIDVDTVVKFTESDSTIRIRTSNESLYVGVGFNLQSLDNNIKIDEYGILYSNDGSITDTSMLTLSSVNGINVKQMENKGNGYLLDKGKGVIAVGYAKVTLSNGQHTVIYSKNIGGHTVVLGEGIPGTIVHPTTGKHYVTVSFTADLDRVGFDVTEYGILYSNNGTITDVSGLTLAAVDSDNVKQMVNKGSGNLLDKGSGVIAVGYAKVTNTSGETAVIYTGNIGGKYSDLV